MRDINPSATINTHKDQPPSSQLKKQSKPLKEASKKKLLKFV